MHIHRHIHIHTFVSRGRLPRPEQPQPPSHTHSSNVAAKECHKVIKNVKTGDERAREREREIGNMKGAQGNATDLHF